MNSSTGGTTKDGNNWGIIKEATNSILGKETTAHNCYGVGTEKCGDAKLLKDRLPLRWEPVYTPRNINNSQIIIPKIDGVQQQGVTP